MSSVFTSVSCSIRYDNSRVIHWTMDPQYTYPEDMSISVERSRAGGQWQPIAENITDSCAYIDSDKRDFNKYLNEFYRVVLKSPSSGDVYVSESCAAGITEAYPYSKEADNAISLIEKEIKLTGRTGVLLKKKEWGKRCPVCTDFNGESSVNEHCPSCLGTGILGGYFNGIPLNIAAQAPSVTQQMTQAGIIQSGVLQARCVAYPWITVGDVWCDTSTNERFYIQNTTPAAMYKSIPMVFQLVMSKIELTDVLHSEKADEKVQAKNPWDEALVTYDPVSKPEENEEQSTFVSPGVVDESDKIDWKTALPKI